MSRCPDLRNWIQQAQSQGELRLVQGAHWRHEVGALTELASRQNPMPALLFDSIPDYPAGYRVVTNTLASADKVALVLGLPLGLSHREMVSVWRERSASLEPIPPVKVSDGPVLENRQQGEDVDLLEFPAPQWHEGDGGRYLGTGDMCITRDPQDGWVNAGTYRVMLHDRNRVGIHIVSAHHGAMHLREAQRRGQSLKIAISLGHHPAFLAASSLEFPYGYCEFDFVGALQDEPVEVITGPYSGLPIPTHCEIVLEGEIVPNDLEREGPFGEWNGYYVSPPDQKPVVRVHSVLYRSEPIILGAPPIRPPAEHSFYRAFIRASLIWEALEAAGVPGVRGVWCHPAGGSRMLNIISLEQQYEGHARQAGLIAAQCQASIYANRYTIVVDEDIDPTDDFQVL